MENDLAEARRSAASSAGLGAGTASSLSSSKGELVQLRREMERLRVRNLELEERLADVLDDEEADVLAGSEEADEGAAGDEEEDALVASSNGR